MGGKKRCFFFSFCKFETYCPVPLSEWESTATYFLLFTGLRLASVSKYIHLFAVNPASTAPSPCPGFSSVLMVH